MQDHLSEETNGYININYLTDISYIIDLLRADNHSALIRLRRSYALYFSQAKKIFSENILFWANFFDEVTDYLFTVPKKYIVQNFVAAALRQPKDHIIYINATDWVIKNKYEFYWLKKIEFLPFKNHLQAKNLIKAHKYAINGIIFLNDLQFISFSYDTLICIWNWFEYSPIVTFAGHTKAVLGIHLLEGNKILSWSIDGTIRIWDRFNGQQIHILQGHTRTIHGVILLEDNKALSYSADYSLRLWNLDTAYCLNVFEGHDSPVWDAIVHNNTLISWSSNGSHGSIIIWDISSGQIIDDIMIFMGDLQSVYLVDNRLVMFPEAGYPGIWNMSTHEWDKEATDGENLMITKGILLDDQTSLLITSKGTMLLWEVYNDHYTARLIGHIGYTQAKIIKDMYILSWSDDKTLRLWNLDRYMLRYTYYGHTNKIQGADILTSDRLLSWSIDHTIRLWNEHGMLLATYQPHQSPVKGLVWSPDRQHMLSWDDDGMIIQWGWVADTDPADRLVGAAPLNATTLLFWSQQGRLYRWDSASRTNHPEPVMPADPAQPPPEPDALAWLPEATRPACWQAQTAHWHLLPEILSTDTATLRAEHTEYAIQIFRLDEVEPILVYPARLRVERVLGFWDEQYLLVAYEHAQIGVFQIMAGLEPTTWTALASG